MPDPKIDSTRQEKIHRGSSFFEEETLKGSRSKHGNIKTRPTDENEFSSLLCLDAAEKLA